MNRSNKQSHIAVELAALKMRECYLLDVHARVELDYWRGITRQWWSSK